MEQPMSRNSLGEAGDKLGPAFDAFLEDYGVMRFTDGPEPDWDNKAAVRVSMFLCFKACLRVFVELLKMAHPTTPLRTLLAELVEKFPTTGPRKDELKAVTNALWKRYPNCVMDASCSEIAQTLEIALHQVEEDYRKSISRQRKARPWRDRGFPSTQAKLLDALDRKDRVDESAVILAVYGADEARRVPEEKLKARLRRLVSDTNESLEKFKCKCRIERYTSRRSGIESSLSLLLL
jgi:hypothetical protein